MTGPVDPVYLRASNGGSNAGYDSEGVVRVRYGMVPDPQHPGGYRIQRKGAGDEGTEAVPIAVDRYCCSGCQAPIATEYVIKIEAERSRGPAVAAGSRATTGFMLITHLCPCSPLALTTRRYRSYRAFVAMFGRGVNLPYQSPFSPSLVSDEDPAVQAWRWELEQTLDVDDFLYWLEHRRPV